MPPPCEDNSNCLCPVRAPPVYSCCNAELRQAEVCYTQSMSAFAMVNMSVLCHLNMALLCSTLLLLSHHEAYHTKLLGCAFVDKCMDIQRCPDISIATSTTTMQKLLKRQQLLASSQDHINTCRQEGRQTSKCAQVRWSPNTDREMGTTSRESMPVWGLWDWCFTRPGSMTYTTPSTVILVSAMLVATITRRQLGGPGANTLACATMLSLSHQESRYSRFSLPK